MHDEHHNRIVRLVLQKAVDAQVTASLGMHALEVSLLIIAVKVFSLGHQRRDFFGEGCCLSVPEVQSVVVYFRLQVGAIFVNVHCNAFLEPAQVQRIGRLDDCGRQIVFRKARKVFVDREVHDLRDAIKLFVVFFARDVTRLEQQDFKSLRGGGILT